MIAPTAIPAFEPPLSPPELCFSARGGAFDSALESSGDALLEGVSKSAEVTLKQGIWILKAVASTNVYNAR